MKLIDVHCHLESDRLLPQLDAVLSDARAAGICKLITASIAPDQWSLSAALAQQHEAVEFAVGIHPWYCADETLSALPSLAQAAQNAVAIGEIGLDAKTMPYPMDRQLEVFVAQLRTARECGLPVILHCRSAFNEMLQAFKQHGSPPGGIIHNFSGSPELADQFIAQGLSFSLGGVLTWRNSAKRLRLVRHIYPDHLLLETDAPDIPPVEARGAANRPANILYNLRAAAEMLGVAAEEVAENTTRNARRIFGLRV